jgi:hypothetical protein
MTLPNGQKVQKTFWDISKAAVVAGYSPRHFRRIIEADNIPVMRIGRKFFIVGRDFETWQLTQQTRLQQEATKPIS